MCVLVKNLCSPPNNDIEYWSWSCAASAPAHTYFFITTLPSNTFGWNKHSQGYSLQTHGNIQQAFMYISLVLGRVVPDCRMWIVFCLFLIIPHQPILLYFSLNHQYLGLVLDIAFLLFTFTTLPHLLSNIWNFDYILVLL